MTDSSAASLPPDLSDWFRSLERPEPSFVRDCSWPAAACRVFRIESSAPVVYLKQHSEQRSFGQERRAYREWADVFERAPDLLASSREKRALLLSGVRGQPLDVESTSRDRRIAYHHSAGRQLSRLHRIQHLDTDPMPLSDAIGRRAAVWSARGRSIVSSRDRRFLAELVESEAYRFRGELRVPCHLDYDERNWLVQPGAEPAVIDFEHARPDHWLADWVRLETGVWSEPGGAELRAAFIAGYGRRLMKEDQVRLDVLSAVWSLATVVWARQRGAERFEAIGRRGLDRARSRFG